VPEVADLVAECNPANLVVAAGGIADGRGLAAALSLGADGVVVGTRLLASREAPVHDEAKSRVIASTSDDTVTTTEWRSNLADDTFRAEGAAEELNGANVFVGEAGGLIHDVLPAATILRRDDPATNGAGGRQHDATRIGRI
jgi:nitronate monooxygenase